MRKLFLVSLVLLGGIVSNGQSKSANSSSYNTALGVKFYPGGITLKHFFNGTNNAGELIGYFWNRGFRLTGLYEIHGNFNGAPGLRWYIGPGATYPARDMPSGWTFRVAIDKVYGQGPWNERWVEMDRASREASGG